MRRTIHISGKIEPFFGTLDENVRMLEDSLHVRTQLHDTRLTIEGEQEAVDQAARIVEEYNHLTRHGRSLSSAEVKSLMRVATDEPNAFTAFLAGRCFAAGPVPLCIDCRQPRTLS